MAGRDGVSDEAAGRPTPVEGADPATGADPGEGAADATLEVRVLAIGPLADGRWLGRGRLPDGDAVDFVTDRLAAERIADALADGRDAIALIRPRQVLG